MKNDNDKYLRWLMYAVVIAVAAFAAIVSYSHIYDLGRGHAQAGTAARLLPLSVDGMILAASLVMLIQSRDPRQQVHWLARLMLWLGIAATVAANVLYGLPSGWLSALISALPALFFVGGVELVMVAVRPARTVPKGVPVARKESVRDIRAKHGVSQATAVKMRTYAAAAVAATQNGSSHE